MVKQCQAHVEVQVNEVPQQVYLNDIMYIYIYYRFIQSIVPARPHPTVCLAQHQVRQVEVPPKKAWNRPGIKWSIVVPLEQKCMWSGAIGPTMSHPIPPRTMFKIDPPRVPYQSPAKVSGIQCIACHQLNTGAASLGKYRSLFFIASVGFCVFQRISFQFLFVSTLEIFVASLSCFNEVSCSALILPVSCSLKVLVP